MTTDLLAQLEATAARVPVTTGRQHPSTLPVKTLVEWFYADCHARNLSTYTLRFYQQKLVFLVEAAGDRQIGELTTLQLKLIVEHFRKEREWNIGNTNHFIVSLKVFFNFLVAEEILDANPAKRIEKLKGDQRIPAPFTPEEVQALFEACGSGFAGARDRTMLALLFDTGMRLGEVMGLGVEDLDLGLMQIRVFGKGRKERLLPFSPPVRRVLLKYITLREGFTTRESALWLNDEGIPLATWAFVSQFRRIAKRAKIVGAHIHKTRHTFAHIYLQQGGSPAMLQRLLGHTSPAMTARYSHAADLDARQDHQQASPLTHLFGPRWKG